MLLILKWLMATVAIMLSGYLIPGVTVAGLWTALWLALFLGLLNVTLRPILIFLTLPINIVTLGLFVLVINALIVLLASTVIQGFGVAGFWPALFFSIVLAIISYLLNRLIK